MLRACVARHLKRTPYCLPLTARYHHLEERPLTASYLLLTLTLTLTLTLALTVQTWVSAVIYLSIYLSTLTLLPLTWKSGIWMAADQL